MKKIALVVCAVLCGVSTTFAKPIGQPPNWISCQNDSSTVALHYTASSVAGIPQFQLIMDGELLFPPKIPPMPYGKEQQWIASDHTVFGTFVHAVNAQPYITRRPGEDTTDGDSMPITSPQLVNAPALVYGFFVPSMSVLPGQTVQFSSLLLTGHRGGLPPSWILPSTVWGPTQHIEQAIEITCEGEVVVFFHGQPQ